MGDRPHIRPRAFDNIGHLGRIIQLRQREAFAPSSNQDQGLYRVLSGFMQTCVTAADGRRYIRAFYVPGEYLWVDGSASCNCTAEAISKTSLLLIEQSVFRMLLGPDEVAAADLWSFLSECGALASRHSFMLARANATEKLSFFLLDFMKRLRDQRCLELPMSRSEIGDHLGLTSETVTRTLTFLQKCGHLRVEGRKIEIMDDKGLLRLTRGVATV